MTTTPEATRGVPLIVGDPAPTFRADHNALAAWARDNKDPSVATVGALPAAGNWPDRKIRVLANGIMYRSDGTSWKPWESDSVAGVFTRATDFTLSNVLQAVPFASAPTLRGLTWLIANPTRIIAIVAGNYLVNGNNIQINSTVNAEMGIRVNGGTNFPVMQVPNSSGAALLAFSQTVTLAAGDYIEIMARSSGAFPWIAANKINVDLLSFR